MPWKQIKNYTEIVKFQSVSKNANPWTTKANMPTGRDTLISATVNNKIYVIGGSNGPSYLSKNEEYDPVTNTWTTKANMPTARYALTSGVVNNKIYVIGGRNSSSSVLSKNEEYDPVTNTWTTKENMPAACSHLTAGVVNNKIYVIGGYNGSSYSSKNEEYDPVTVLLAPVKSGDIVYYRGNCIVKVDTQTIPSNIPTTIVKGGYLTLENGTLEYGWLKKQHTLNVKILF